METPSRDGSGATTMTVSWRLLVAGSRALAAAICLCAPAATTTPAMACKCQQSLDVCAETFYSNVVFAGTVESITPDFMTHWKPASREPIARINSALEQYRRDQSPSRFTSLKDAVRSALPGLDPESRRRLDTATSTQSLADLLSSVLGGSRRVRFHVRTLFRKADDDGKADVDDDDAPEFLEVLTPFGECGNDFQIGETYLVYATGDEETDVLSTDACSRTRRASDAGADLAYLSFYKDRKNPAGRVQGFATYDLQYQAHPHEAERIGLPAGGMVVELKSKRGSRYSTANEFGQFVFDGADAGDYSLGAYAAGFPATSKVVSGPQDFHLDPRACITRILAVPKEER